MPYHTKKKKSGPDSRKIVRALDVKTYDTLADLAFRHRDELAVKSVSVKTFHGKELKALICADCGYQNTKKVSDSKCLDTKACEKRQKEWR